jgi:uncharacterized protein YheU (UPF0270 family)
MIIPHRMLSPEALQGVIEEFVTRDGTDYGVQEIALEGKVARVRSQLERGISVIVYDRQDGSITILPKDQLPAGLGTAP